MSSFNNGLSNVIDHMYEMRSNIRTCYMHISQVDLYSLTENIKNNIKIQLKSIKYNIYINIPEFTISIDLNEEKPLSEKKITNIVSTIDSILREFLNIKVTDNEVKQYINSSQNSILDFYIVGNSIKFLL